MSTHADWEDDPNDLKIYHLEEEQKCGPPDLNSFMGDVGYPECEACGQFYIIGGGQMMHICNYKCVCGHIWGTDFPHPDALQRGGVFYQGKEQHGMEGNAEPN